MSLRESIRLNKLSLQIMIGLQAEDEGLWFKAETITEAYLQQELRKLTEATEKFLLGIDILGLEDA